MRGPSRTATRFIEPTRIQPRGGVAPRQLVTAPPTYLPCRVHDRVAWPDGRPRFCCVARAGPRGSHCPVGSIPQILRFVSLLAGALSGFWTRSPALVLGEIFSFGSMAMSGLG
jgi:hypothetical protein